ncbi:integral membrane protein [Aspergillus sclerotioniger CBS 115572]|uniref:Integral membrane protein n=1 Tax=Aspergillus sclerotioniger CBS 115572 TaxID=1450535 RepID=A0A317XEN2_9EURO|nr:integral membrane protein [Aspergillus sclerotioniger CBS 115572]PWY96661.1 integral membrane protein [Aspergillus sclerotioniger CBS 115572]
MSGGLHPPLSVIESWPAPNTIDPESHSPAALILSAIFGGIAVATVSLRLWARCVIQRQAGLDDIFIALCLIPTIGLSIAVPLGAYVYGENHHTWDNSLTLLLGERKLAIAEELFYVFASCFVKVSVLLFYRRMGHRTTISRSFLTIIYVSIGSVVAYNIAFLIVIFLSCRPWSAYWMQIDPTYALTQNYHCYDEPAHLIAATAISLTQDIISTTLPAVLCWRLQMSIKQKLLLNVVFGLGYLAAVVAGIRIYFVYRMFYESYDASWEVWYCWILAMMEINIAVTCSSLPAVKVFFQSVGSQHGSTESSTGKSRTWHSQGRSRSWSWKKETSVHVAAVGRKRTDGEQENRRSNDTERDLLGVRGSIVEMKDYGKEGV